jgi:hypothetical protein
MLYSNRSAWIHVSTVNDGPTQWEQRVQRIKADLPSSGVIGYLSERDVPGLDFNPIDADEELAMTQYFLAPLIVEEGASRQYIFANFSDPQVKIASVERQFGIRMLNNYGMGIYLFEK